ncbi:MAG: hypothetical protein INQ03_25400 [Candidatus Heimdallarchaeota archaeon]|nr:hypothetical protein [Candidatus Heimdallarchaeota archaeon]
MDWYKITLSSNGFHVNIEPSSISYSVTWDEIIRICFKPGDLFDQDELLIFVKNRENSYLIPMEASGALELWTTIIDKGYFDPEIAIQAAKADEGIFCWPEFE